MSGGRFNLVLLEGNAPCGRGFTLLLEKETENAVAAAKRGDIGQVFWLSVAERGDVGQAFPLSIAGREDIVQVFRLNIL